MNSSLVTPDKQRSAPFEGSSAGRNESISPRRSGGFNPSFSSPLHRVPELVSSDNPIARSIASLERQRQQNRAKQQELITASPRGETHSVDANHAVPRGMHDFDVSAQVTGMDVEHHSPRREQLYPSNGHGGDGMARNHRLEQFSMQMAMFIGMNWHFMAIHGLGS